ncbi:MAG: GTPase ObgE [Oscillospiraceae bacterium]|nr:GTPase ObgE [Oscillospiraceae bacterium]
MIIDRVKLYIKAGDGGDGMVSFHREKYVTHGGPDGGDGGAGGNVIFRTETGENTLTKYKYRRKFIADSGQKGKSGKMNGKGGEDIILLVPVGTVIKDVESGLVIKDMSDGEDFLICRGGRGGWGNRHFATPTRQAPNFAKPGLAGQEREVLLELKMLADVGLIGMPNVGKSSLLSIISAARPKIENYHFTTLYPGLGVVDLGEGRGFVAADIPGLIEGASDGVGLGHAFLRHIERCRLLVHLVDVSCSEGRDPLEDIRLINAELAQYSEELAKKPQIIVGNKVDMLIGDPKEREVREKIDAYAAGEGADVVYISAYTGENVDSLLHLCERMLAKLPPIAVFHAEVEMDELTRTDGGELVIRREDGMFVVEAEWLYNLMGPINFSDHESLMYFQRILRDKGVMDALRDKGMQDGDTVSIYGFEFENVE